MRLKLGSVTLAILVGALLLTACGGHSLKGSTWKGNGLLTGNVTLTFVNDTECQMGVGSVGATGTYSVDNDNVSVSVLKKVYTFAIDGDTMTGHLYGMTLTLDRQK
jgi:hypothetical protein